MNTRHLTKKYKHKSRSKKSSRSRRTRRRVLKGGVPSVSRRTLSSNPSSNPSPRPSSNLSSRPSSIPSSGSIFKQSTTPREEKLIDSFFRNLEEEEENFEKTLCVLYHLYNSLSRDKLNEILHSNSFKIRYEKAFYTKDLKINYDGFKSCNIRANSKYILFLSYIFKKIVKGGFIRCNGIRQDFVYNRDKSKIRMLTVLKRFLGYLDTACVTTTSYPITIKRYNQILNRTATEVTKEEYAMYKIVSNLQILVKWFPSLQNILDTMTLNNPDGSIVSYNINTTVISRLIRQSYTVFLEPIREDDEDDTDS